MKIRPVGTELSHADEKTARISKHTAAFRSFPQILGEQD
jgi:hypothetical protein